MVKTARFFITLSMAYIKSLAFGHCIYVVWYDFRGYYAA